MLWHAAQDEQVREHIDDVDRFQSAIDADRQAFMGELVDVRDELLLIVSAARDPALGRAVLPEYTADPSLRNLQSEPDMVDAGTATRGAYQFPEAASFRISLSSVRSATARRSRAFSASSSFIRFT